MEISVDKNNSQILLSLTGRLDNLTAASLQHAVDVNVSDYSTGANVCIDFFSVDFCKQCRAESAPAVHEKTKEREWVVRD